MKLVLDILIKCPSYATQMSCFFLFMICCLSIIFLLLALDDWPAPPGCLPCTSWMLGLLLLASDLILLDWYYFGGVQK
jgi:hypothetical protein